MPTRHLSTLLLLAACAPEPAPPADTSPTDTAPDWDIPLLAEASPTYADTLAESGAEAAVPTAAGQVLLSAGGTVWLDDARATAPTAVEDAPGPAQAAAWVDDVLLLSADDALWAWDGDLWPSPLSALISAPVEAIHADPDGRLWLRSTDALHRWDGGQLDTLSFGTAQAVAMATDGQIEVAGAVSWVGLADGLAVALDRADEPVEQAAFLDVWQLTTDSGGRAWLNDGGGLWVRFPAAAQWVRLPLTDACTTVMAHPSAETVWVATTQGAHVGSADGLRPAAVDTAGWMAVDAQGRLLQRQDGALLRISAGRSLSWLDQPERVEQTQTLTLMPSTMDGIQSVDIQLDGQPLEANAPPWQVTVAPADFTKGETRQLNATVTWTDGTTAVATAALRGALGAVTWDDDIQGLYETRCAQCHAGDADTVLNTPERWQALIDPIIAQVESGAMPLGGDRLTVDDVDRIKAWMTAGFP